MIKISNILLSFLLSFILSSVIAFGQNKYIDSLNNALKTSTDTNRINILLNLGFENHVNNPLLGIKQCEEALRLAREKKMTKKIAKGYSNISLCYWKLNNLSKAHNYIDSANHLYQKVSYYKGIAITLLNKGIIYYSGGQPAIAVQYYLDALDFAKELKLNDLKNTCLINTGLAYHELQDLQKGLEYYILAEKSMNSNSTNICILYINMTEAYNKLNILDKAEEYSDKAINISEMQNDSINMGYSYLNKGAVLIKLKKYNSAYKYIISGLAIHKSKNDLYGLVDSYKYLADLYSSQKKYMGALNYYQKSLELLNAEVSVDEKNQLFKALSITYEKLGDLKNSLKFYKMYTDSTLVFIDKVNLNRISELQTEYETQEKEQENKLLKSEVSYQKELVNTNKIIATVISIALLFFVLFIAMLLRNRSREKKVNKTLLVKNKEIQSKQKEIEKQNKSLEEANATKDKFFSILAHDLKNPFGVVINYSSLLNDNYENLTESEKKEISNQILNSVKKANYLLDNLLTWSRSSRNCIEMNKISLSLNELVNSATKPYEELANLKEIKILKDIEPNLDIYTDKYMLETVIGNLTNNAIKFSPVKSEVIVKGEKESNKTKIIIEDHGVGMEKNTLKNIFNLAKVKSTQGTFGEKGTGLGLVLVKDFIEKLGGKINVESFINNGSKFYIEIPTK